MFARLFGARKKEKEESTPLVADREWSFLKTDMHSHLIPGIDDGAPTIEASLEMILAFREMGYQSLVTTPHIKSDHYKNNPGIILSGLAGLKESLKEHGIDMPVKAAAEYYVDEVFMEMLDEGSLLTINNNEVLIEFSFMTEPANLNHTLFAIQTKGYKPVLAHPERYAFFHAKKGIYSELKDRGCLLQLNLLSVSGYYGRAEKEIAEKLLSEGLYDYCGSDMHHAGHAENMKKLAQSRTFELLRNYPFRNSRIVVS